LQVLAKNLSTIGSHLFSPRENTKEMRVLFDKKHYTKAERIFGEILKRNHLPFRSKVIIEGREVDFLIGNLVIEIGNHSQDKEKNKLIIEAGYSMLFISNTKLYNFPFEVEKHLLSKKL
jgi:very-short-patch-repair endonuclease